MEKRNPLGNAKIVTKKKDKSKFKENLIELEKALTVRTKSMEGLGRSASTFKKMR